jgi:hypothetical protein
MTSQSDTKKTSTLKNCVLSQPWFRRYVQGSHEWETETETRYKYEIELAGAENLRASVIPLNDLRILLVQGTYRSGRTCKRRFRLPSIINTEIKPAFYSKNGIVTIEFHKRPIPTERTVMEFEVEYRHPLGSDQTAPAPVPPQEIHL